MAQRHAGAGTRRSAVFADPTSGKLEEVAKPEIAADQALVRVEAAGMSRTDFQLIDGYFREHLDLAFPAIPGHEIAGSVAEIGDAVPATANLSVGDQVVVVGGLGDGTCRQCRLGNEQICGHGNWPGFGKYGGYTEFVPIPQKYLIRVDPKYKLSSEELAPLTDAGLTPYRGIKKLRLPVCSGDRLLAVFGAGGLGTYVVQYAKLLSSGRPSWCLPEVTRNSKFRKSMAPITSSTRAGSLFPTFALNS